MKKLLLGLTLLASMSSFGAGLKAPAKCEVENVKARLGWVTLRSFYMNYYDINMEDYSRNGKLTGKLSFADATQPNVELKEYIKSEELAQYIKESYAALIVLNGLMDKSDRREFYTDTYSNYPLLRSRNFYMNQAEDSKYSTVLSLVHGTISVCEYLSVVDQLFDVDVPPYSRL